MWKSLYALSVAVLAGIAPAAAQSQEMPKSFEETLKFILFGDSTKSESIPRTVYGSTVTIALTDVDAKNCTAAMVTQSDTPNHGEVKVTFTIDFKAVLKRQLWRDTRLIMLTGTETSPVVKSAKIEWLRVDTDKARKEKARSDNKASSDESSVVLVGDDERAEEAMEYLLKTLCPNPNRAF